MTVFFTTILTWLEDDEEDDVLTVGLAGMVWQTLQSFLDDVLADAVFAMMELVTARKAASVSTRRIRVISSTSLEA
jgi:hypothetical protein